MRAEDKDKILTEVQSRVVESTIEGAKGSGRDVRHALEEILADSVYHERRRLREDRKSPVRDQDKLFWRAVQKELGTANERTLADVMRRAVRHYASEICGNFDDRVYRVATKVLPTALSVLLNSISPKRLVTKFPQMPGIDETVVLQGETEHVRKLHEAGTVVFAPTHLSNLDSIILGYSIFRLGLPPVIYGAGLNLFTNPIMGYFMRNLGAYTVDRRKRDPLYKTVLKEYATLTLEHGYDNLFFPGGTRGRSGALERRLKLGLMGTTVTAYTNNLRTRAARPKLFVVPVTLSFKLVLEAETLIDDFLKEVGKGRYIITDDEFSKPTRVADFFRQLIRMNSRMYVTFGRGHDPFGNPVDEQGESLDPNGRFVDPARYVLQGGMPVHDTHRDKQYTAELGARIGEAFSKYNVIQSTHVLARAMFTLLRLHNRTDIVRLLRVGGQVEDMELREVYREVDRVLSELRGLSDRGGIMLDPVVARSDAEDLVADAISAFASYHARQAVTRKGDRLFASDRNLLFYYHNRLEGYRLDRNAGGDSGSGLLPALSDDHRTLRRSR